MYMPVVARPLLLHNACNLPAICTPGLQAIARIWIALQLASKVVKVHGCSEFRPPRHGTLTPTRTATAEARLVAVLGNTLQVAVRWEVLLWAVGRPHIPLVACSRKLEATT